MVRIEASLEMTEQGTEKWSEEEGGTAPIQQSSNDQDQDSEQYTADQEQATGEMDTAPVSATASAAQSGSETQQFGQSEPTSPTSQVCAKCLLKQSVC